MILAHFGGSVESNTKLRHRAEQRLEFIEFRLFWEGRLNRTDITERYGVSVPQASNDLTLYQEIAPNNLHYDKREKCYLPTDNFSPKFLQPNAERYLAQLKALGDAVIGLDDTFMSTTPSVGVVPIPGRHVEPGILRKLVGAVRHGKSVNVFYQSMNPERPVPIWRVITPHAFVTDGLRWHFRGYCHLRKQFRDFLISRCLDVGEMSAPGATQAEDYEWTTFFNVNLIPNPSLSTEQQRIIALDYEMDSNRISVPVRRALMYYFNKRLRFDVTNLDASDEKAVVIENDQEYERVLAEVTGNKPQQPERT